MIRSIPGLSYSSSPMKTNRVCLISLGCPKNLVDSETILGLLPAGRYQTTPRLEEADIGIVNTCAFMQSARDEAREIIEKAADWKRRSGGKLVIAGCLVQYHGRRAKDLFPSADLLLGVGEFTVLPKALEEGGNKGSRLYLREVPRFPFHHSLPRRLSTPRHTAYLRIADGCDNRCSYCLIPDIRGPYQGRSLSSIISEARRLVERGVKEIILIAQDTAYFDYGRKKQSGLSRLLEKLNEIDGLSWIRVLYAHPRHLDNHLLQTIDSCGKVCPYLDVPLQHINDSILGKMGRRISRARIEAVLQRARETVEGISLRTTLMVGFPGEGEDEFRELVEFVRTYRFSHLGVFTYSPERGTPAYRYGKGAGKRISHRRREVVLEIQSEISAENLRSFRGREITVLIDGPFPGEEAGLMVGRGVFQAPEIDGMVVVAGEGMKAGDMVSVRITDSSDYDLYGTIISAAQK